MTETSGAADPIGVGSGFAIFSACGCARRSHGQKGFQISTIGFRRGRLIVDEAGEASARVVESSLLDQHVGHVLHQLHPVAAEFSYEASTRGAVAFADRMNE